MSSRLKFDLVREVDVSGGFVADANPNSTAPSAGTEYDIPERDGQEYANGVSIYVRGVDGTAAEIADAAVDFTLWAQDSGASASKPGPGGKARYVFLASETAAPSSGLYTSRLLGRIFVQLTSAQLHGATKLQIFAAPRKI